MDDTVTVGLVGTGSISQAAHIPAWQKVPGVEIAAVAEPVEENRRTALDALGDPDGARVATYAGYDDLFASESLDLVDVAIPPGEAKEGAIRAAIDAGVGVTCQKPFAEEYGAAVDLVEAAEREDVILSVNQQARYAGAFARGRERLDDGDLGDLRTIQVRSDFGLVGDEHWLHYSVHSFDLVRFWAGREPERVMAWYTRQTGDDRYLLSVWLDFGDDLAAHVWDEFSSNTMLRWEYRLMGDGGTARGHEVFDDRMIDAEAAYTPAREFHEVVEPTATTYVPDAFAGYFEALAGAVRGEREVPTSGADNLKTLAVAFAARKSAREERWVDVDEAVGNE